MNEKYLTEFELVKKWPNVDGEAQLIFKGQKFILMTVHARKPLKEGDKLKGHVYTFGPESMKKIKTLEKPFWKLGGFVEHKDYVLKKVRGKIVSIKHHENDIDCLIESDGLFIQFSSCELEKFNGFEVGDLVEAICGKSIPHFTIHYVNGEKD